MANFMIRGMAAGTLHKEFPATYGIGTAATYTAGALQVGLAAFGLVSKKMRNNL